MRLDKWLWAARFFKTRSLAQQAIESGRVTLNRERVKSSHVLKLEDGVAVRVGELEWQVRVKGLSDKRGPAAQARKLYEETEASKAQRERRIDIRKFSPEPAATIKGRPTKRDRRTLERFTQPDEEG
jgi:ribosome-associated heat shock protein Hsp15